MRPAIESNPDAAIMSVNLAREEDIVIARHRARQLSSQLGFANQDQVRIATAVSELARNAYQYARGGRVDFYIALASDPQCLCVRISDKGPGVAGLVEAAAERSEPVKDKGIGLAGTRRLMDVFEIDSRPGQGTTVRIGKVLPGSKRLSHADIHGMVSQVAGEQPPRAFDEVRAQNRELLETLSVLRAKETELAQSQALLRRLEAEIEETNRGVVALYAELEEKAAALRRADELKSRFLSHVSHEFRTPLNSIMALSKLLLDRADGDLTTEQERQAGYIRRAAQDLVEMVNDLLDLAKVESGKTDVHKSRIQVAQLFGALRGVMRPLVANDAVALIVEEPPAGLEIFSDEAKISQILRNLISNALKFTERGEVRVSCLVFPADDCLRFIVSDTGIGIAPADQDRIFQEFTQVLNPVQTRVKGTGLGLPLSRKLATLLGGELEVASTPGEGSTFTLSLPHASSASSEEPGQLSDAILIIDDDEKARYIARQMFRGSPYRVLEAVDGPEGAERARFERPALILLDLVMPGRSGFDVLEELKADPSTEAIPVVIHTSRKLEPSDYDRLAGRHAAVLPKGEGDREEGLAYIRRLLSDPNVSGGPPHT
jgi:signal transduction histidine kinase/CheY-like chemotaxis protein